MKKIKIIFGEPEFFVNEEKKTVACKLSGRLEMPFPIFGLLFTLGPNLPTKVDLSAVAKCSPEDKFDIEKGKRIALAKAENKIHDYFFSSFYVPFFSYLGNLVINIEDFFSNKSGKFILHNCDYIDNISNGEFKIKKPLNKGVTKFISKKAKD